MENAIFLTKKDIRESEEWLKEYEEANRVVKLLIDFIKKYNPFYVMELEREIINRIYYCQNWLSIMYKHLDRLEKGEIQIENPWYYKIILSWKN